MNPLYLKSLLLLLIVLLLPNPLPSNEMLVLPRHCYLKVYRICPRKRLLVFLFCSLPSYLFVYILDNCMIIVLISLFGWLTRRVPLVEQELLTLPEHLSSPLVFSVVRGTRSLVLYVCFVDRCLTFCTFSFGHCVVCSSSIYRFRLPLWYLQTLLIVSMKWFS